MRIAHRHPVTDWWAIPESDPVDDDYAAEVQRAVERGEREYQQARERLERAQKRLATAQTQRARSGHKKRVAQLQALVAERRAELAEIERLMTAAPIVLPDKQVRLRTGLDEHLELGEYRREHPQQVRPSPVTITNASLPTRSQFAAQEETPS